MLKPTQIIVSCNPEFYQCDVENVEFCTSVAIITASIGSHVVLSQPLLSFSLCHCRHISVGGGRPRSSRPRASHRAATQLHPDSETARRSGCVRRQQRRTKCTELHGKGSLRPSVPGQSAEFQFYEGLGTYNSFCVESISSWNCGECMPGISSEDLCGCIVFDSVQRVRYWSVSLPMLVVAEPLVRWAVKGKRLELSTLNLVVI